MVDAERMRENLELTHGALFSQRVLLALVESGMLRDDAYRVVQRLAQQATDSRVHLRELLAADPAGAGLDLDAIFDYGPFMRYADEIVGAARRDRPEPLSGLRRGALVASRHVSRSRRPPPDRHRARSARCTTSATHSC